MTSENETYLVRPLPRKKRYAWGSNWKQIHLPLAHEMLHHQEKRTIEFEGNRYLLNAHSESGDLFDLSIELLTTPNIRREEAHIFQMRRSQSFFHPENKDKFNFQDIEDGAAALTKGRGRVSGNFRGTKIIYKRYKPDNERERSLRRKEIEYDLKCALNCIDLPEFMVKDVEHIVNESQPVDIELICRRFRVSDLFAPHTYYACLPYLVIGPLPHRKHVLKFYTSEQQSKQIKLVRNQFERTVDYDADLLTPEEAMLFANAADWMTTSNCKTFCSKPFSVESHIQVYFDNRTKRAGHIDIKNENEAKDVSALENSQVNENCTW